VFPSEASEDISPTNIRPPVVESYTRLFGRLPDIIRLHEQTGDFDGQIVFIGHPNRDVSAHQWLSVSFQWVNIGLWSHTRKRVEGSLASDHVPGAGFPQNSVEYFKFIAENREAMIKKYGRPAEEQEVIICQPAFNEPMRSGTMEKQDPRPAPMVPTTKINQGQLEDPFVTPVRNLHATPFTFHGSGSGNIGSMDFNYEFPLKSVATQPDSQQRRIQREREQLEQREQLRMLYREGSLRELPPELREVGFGEEAASAFTTPVTQPDLSQLLNQLDLNSQGVQLSQPSNPGIDQCAAGPDFTLNDTDIRALFPPGPTVANPYRGVSTLNAASAPFRFPEAKKPSEKGTTPFETSAFSASTTLRYSDPDDARTKRIHEIANGFNQQGPTKQKWTGPFFIDSMPTTKNPTASLAVAMSEEGKLANWFRDGESVGRQQDYAKRLIAQAQAEDKTHNFGVIGQASPRIKDESRYENTPLFIRLHENLDAYKQPPRNGEGRDYFSRAWKSASAPAPAPSAVPQANSKPHSNANSSSQKLQRASNRKMAPAQFGGGSMGVAGVSNSSFTGKYKRSMVAEGFKGPLSGRY